MKTRQRGRADGVPTDYSKDMIDPRDLGDDGDDTNGYYDDKADDAVRARGNTRTAREGGNRRGGRVPRAVNMRSKADKNLIESAEFQEVVKGFFDFIEEIKKKKGRGAKPGPPKPPKSNDEQDTGRKKIKLDTQSGQSQPAGKSELLVEEEKNDKNSSLYSFKQDINARKELLDSRDNKDSNLFPSLQPQGVTAKGDQAKQKDVPANKPPIGQNYLPSANLPALNAVAMAKQQAATKTLQSLYYDNPGVDRFPLPNFGANQDVLRSLYMPPYDNYPYNLTPNQLINLQILESLLQKNPPNLLGSLLDPGQAAGFYDLQRELQQYRAPQQLGLGNQRFGNQGIGTKLTEAETEANPKGFEGKLGRAATHVAIAYFIYFKSLDPESISRSDKTKMDPTYNARMLKEKRTEPYPNEIPSMMGKMSGYYGGGMEVENGYQPSVEYLERQIMDGQRLFRNPELNQALAAYKNQGKADQKLEEEKVEAGKKRANEAPKQAAKRQPKEEEIIEIKENSDVEVEEQKPKEPNIAQQSKTEQAKGSEKAKEKPASVSADDIVQKITELTGHSSGDGEKGDKRKNGRRTAGKNAEDGAKGPVNQKTYAVAEEGKTPILHTNVKESKQKEEPKTIEVISSDEAPVIEEKTVKEDKLAKEEKKDQEREEKTEKMEKEGNEEKEGTKTESRSVNPQTEDKEEKSASKPE